MFLHILMVFSLFFKFKVKKKGKNFFPDCRRKPETGNADSLYCCPEELIFIRFPVFSGDRPEKDHYIFFPEKGEENKSFSRKNKPSGYNSRKSMNVFFTHS